MAPLSLTSRNLVSVLLLMMFILEMVFMVWGYEQMASNSLSSQYGMIDKNNAAASWSERERVREWRWRNRNRLRNRRLRMGLNGNGKQNGGGQGQKRGGGKSGKRNFIQNPAESIVYDMADPIESCCPTVSEVIELVEGRNSSGHLVQLYKDGPIRQRFFESSCQKGVMNKPCRFLENRHSRKSRCTQKYSLTYALVRPQNVAGASTVAFSTSSGGNAEAPPHYMSWPPRLDQPQEQQKQLPWSLDYITIRSGCACQIVQTQRKRNKFLRDT